MQVHSNTSGLFPLQPECLANKAEALQLSSQDLLELSQELGGGRGGRVEGAGENNCYSVFFNEMYCPLLKDCGCVFCYAN
jgi:hypothetical protein